MTLLVVRGTLAAAHNMAKKASLSASLKAIICKANECERPSNQKTEYIHSADRMCTLASSLLCEIVVVAAVQPQRSRALKCQTSDTLWRTSEFMWISKNAYCELPRGGEGGTRAELSSRRPRGAGGVALPSNSKSNLPSFIITWHGFQSRRN